jgi:hypothetical protein
VREVCVDIGSTWTKAALVDTGTGELLDTAQAPTTPGDVVAGVLSATAGFGDVPVRACSSAGGGLRLAVVGYEELISAEAGHRAALSAGARVVHVAAGRLDDAGLAALAGAAPDVVLLVGGTDGGDAGVLRANAAVLARADRSVPVVLAGNVAVRDEVTALLRAWVRAVTPDAVLDGVVALAGLRADADVPGVLVRCAGTCGRRPRSARAVRPRAAWAWSCSPAGSSGTPRHRRWPRWSTGWPRTGAAPAGCWPGAGSWSTPATCWPRPGCSPATPRPRPRDCWVDS